MKYLLGIIQSLLMYIFLDVGRYNPGVIIPALVLHNQQNEGALRRRYTISS